MRGLLAILCLTLPITSAIAQEDTLRSLVVKGLALNDKGDYSGAVALYNQAIGYNDNYYLAHVEKATTLYSAGRFQEAIDECKLVLQKFKDSTDNGLVYADYGSSLDGMGDTLEAVKMYKEGMGKFPQFYVLPLNKAIAEFNRGNMGDAINDLETSLWLEPVHATSHQILGDAVSGHNRIAGLLAYMTFLLIEPDGPRAGRNLKKLLKLLTSNLRQKDSHHVFIAVPEPDLSKDDGENDFHTAEVELGVLAASDFLPSHKANTDRAKYLATLLRSISPENKYDPGFFVAFYIPFLFRMESAGMLETASHIILTSLDDDGNNDWLAANQDKVNGFYTWFKKFRWVKVQ